MEKQSSQAGQLIRLSQIEYEADPNQPELIGWTVLDANGDVIGSLNDMLVDMETGEIPFGSICYDNKCTAVPLELIFLDEQNKQLVLPVTREDMADAPDFTDETEDIQPYVDFWNEVIADWQEDVIIEEETEISRDERRM